MSIVSTAVDVPKQIVRTVLSPKTLLIGIGVTAVTLFVMSRVLPGIGQFAGLNTYPWLPQFTDKLAFWPFVPMAMNGNGNRARVVPQSYGGIPIRESAGSDIIGSVNSAQGYINSMLQVT